MEDIKNVNRKEQEEVWMSVNGRAMKVTKPQKKNNMQDLKDKMDENESFTDQIETLMQYLESSIKVSNQNAAILSGVLEQQKKFSEEKVLVDYFSKMNKLLDYKSEKDESKIQESSQKLEKMNSNLISKKSTFEDLDGLQFVLDTNSEIWKNVSGQIQETESLKVKVAFLEKENKKFKEKMKSVDVFKVNIVQKINDFMRVEKESRKKVVEDCFNEISIEKEERDSTIGELKKSVDQLKENYNWQIEDLNTKINNRVDLQQLETTVESINTKIASQPLNIHSASHSCLFTKNTSEVT